MEFMSPATAYLAALLVKGALLAAIVALTVRLLRSASSATRHFVWGAGMVMLLALPVALLVLPEWSLPVIPTEVEAAPEALAQAPVPSHIAGVESPLGSSADEEAMGGESATDATDILLPTGASRVGLRDTLSARTARVLGWLPIVWVIGVFVSLARLAVRTARLQGFALYASEVTDDRAVRIAREARDRLGLRRPVRVVTARGASVPFTCGVRRPVVVLPEGLAGWSAERLSAAILHEMAHVRRRDYQSLLVAEVVGAVHWMNPVVWMARREARKEMERSCDDAVIKAGMTAPDYANHLVSIARFASRSALAGALGMARESTLGQRVNDLLAAGRDRGPTARRTVSVATTLVAVMAASLATARLSYASDAALPGDSPDELRALWQSARGFGRLDLNTMLARLEDPSPEVRGVAALGLGERGAKEAIRPLVHALGDSDAYVRENAILALRRLDDPLATDAILRMPEDSEAGVRSVHVWTLGQLGGDEAAERLIGAIRRDTDTHTRGMALSALAQTRSALAFEFFRDLTESSGVDARRQGVQGLQYVDDDRVVPVLLGLFSDESEPLVRQRIVRALTAKKGPQALEGLLVALDDPDRMVRKAALHAVGEREEPEAVEGLLRALRDPEHTVRLTAAWILEGVQQ